MKFKVIYSPDEGGAWNARVPSVRGCQTWGRSLDAARRYVREALASCIDELGPDAERIAEQAELEESYDLPAVVKGGLRRYLRSREVLKRLEAELQEASRALATQLVDQAHLSLRDAGDLLDLSHERVHQLVSPPAKKARKARHAAPSGGGKSPGGVG